MIPLIVDRWKCLKPADRFTTLAMGILIMTAMMIMFIGLTAGLAIISACGLAYLFIGVCKALQNQSGSDLGWAITDIGISLGLGFIGTLMAGLRLGGATGLLAGLLVSIYLSTCLKGKFTLSKLILGMFKSKKTGYDALPRGAFTRVPRPRDYEEEVGRPRQTAKVIN